METYTFSTSFTLGDMLVHPVHIRVERLRLLIPAHRHSRTSYELHCAAEGHGTVSVGGARYAVAPGDIYLTGPEVTHEQTCDAADPILEYCLYLDARTLEGGAFRLEGLRSAAFHITRDDGTILPMLKAVAEEMRAARPDSEETACALLRYLLIRLNRESMGYAAARPAPPAVSAPGYPDIEDAFFYRYAALRLEDIAAMLRLSPRQTQRFLQTHYGKTFSEKRREAQMNAAKQLLDDPSLTVTEIAEKVGFSGVEHFSSAFRAYSGMTPRAYRDKRDGSV